MIFFFNENIEYRMRIPPIIELFFFNFATAMGSYSWVDFTKSQLTFYCGKINIFKNNLHLVQIYFKSQEIQTWKSYLAGEYFTYWSLTAV